MQCGKSSKLLEYHESFSYYNVIREDGRECFKKEEIWQSAAKPFIQKCINGRFRDYNEEFLQANTCAEEYGIVHAC
jgi:hypothetical protein